MTAEKNVNAPQSNMIPSYLKKISFDSICLFSILNIHGSRVALGQANSDFGSLPFPPYTCHSKRGCSMVLHKWIIYISITMKYLIDRNKGGGE